MQEPEQCCQSLLQTQVLEPSELHRLSLFSSNQTDRPYPHVNNDGPEAGLHQLSGNLKVVLLSKLNPSECSRLQPVALELFYEELEELEESSFFSSFYLLFCSDVGLACFLSCEQPHAKMPGHSRLTLPVVQNCSKELVPILELFI